jgi:hypothetical protein
LTDCHRTRIPQCFRSRCALFATVFGGPPRGYPAILLPEALASHLSGDASDSSPAAASAASEPWSPCSTARWTQLSRASPACVADRGPAGPPRESDVGKSRTKVTITLEPEVVEALPKLQAKMEADAYGPVRYNRSTVIQMAILLMCQKHGVEIPWERDVAGDPRAQRWKTLCEASPQRLQVLPPLRRRQLALEARGLVAGVAATRDTREARVVRCRARKLPRAKKDASFRV